MHRVVQIAIDSRIPRPYAKEAREAAITLLHPRASSERVVMKNDIHLPVRRDEVPVLRFTLDHALSSISEAHAEDRAQLKALIQLLEAAKP